MVQLVVRRRRIPIAAATALLAALALGPALPVVTAEAAPAPVTYSYIDLGVLPHPPSGQTYSTADAVNSSREAVGTSFYDLGADVHGFSWVAGHLRDLGDLLPGPRGSSVADGINDAGVVVGDTSVDGDEPPHAFALRGGTLQDLGTGYGPGSGSEASDVNSSGQVVGTHFRRQGRPARAVLWSGGRTIDLGTLGGTSPGLWGPDESIATAINDAGQVVGTALPASGVPLHAFLWQDGRMRDLGTLGGTGEATQAADINRSGVVVGESQTRQGPSDAFLWRNGTMLDLGRLGKDFAYSFSAASAVNDAGVVVGTSNVPGPGYGQPKAFVWRNGVMRALDALTPDRPAGRTLQYAADVNRDGVIVGGSCSLPCTNDQHRAFMLVPR